MHYYSSIDSIRKLIDLLSRDSEEEVDPSESEEELDSWELDSESDLESEEELESELDSLSLADSEEEEEDSSEGVAFKVLPFFWMAMRL